MKKVVLTMGAALLAFAMLSAVGARSTRGELDYAAEWCAAAGGVAEVVLIDRTRVDCVTQTHAIEVERAGKWPEAIGQALHYARLTGLRPGIVIIRDTAYAERYVTRLRATVSTWRLPIDIWEIDG